MCVTSYFGSPGKDRGTAQCLQVSSMVSGAEFAHMNMC